MNPKDIANAKNPDLRASPEALRRAAQLAREAAIRTGTDLVVVEGGRTQRIPAAKLREQSDLKNGPAS